MLTILLATFIAAIVSEEQLEDNELSEDLPDLFTEGQRLRFYRFPAVRLVRNNKQNVPDKPVSGYSGYRSGYGAFRGRRSNSQTQNL